MRKNLKILLVMAMALIFASCAAAPPPTTTEDIQLIKNLQGTWTADSAKVESTLKINGQEVTVYHKSLHPVLDKIDPNRINQQKHPAKTITDTVSCFGMYYALGFLPGDLIPR